MYYPSPQIGEPGSEEIYDELKAEEESLLINNNLNGLKRQPPKTFDEVLLIRSKTNIPTDGIYLKSYWKILLITALFYAVPSIQFVIVQYYARSDDDNSRDGVFCYYNYKCDRHFLGLSAFNNILSNILYLFNGLAFLLLVRLQETKDDDPLYGTGLHNDKSLYYCLGWSLVLEGIFSALYHVCPSRLNFQFDTTYMIIGSTLLFITLYQKRQPTLVSGPFQVFGFFGMVTFLNTIALIRMPVVAFWIIAILMISYVLITGSIHLYYYERLRMGSDIFKRIWKRIAHPSIPRDPVRFGFILAGLIFDYILMFFAVRQAVVTEATEDFPSFLLGLIVLDLLIYMFYYTVMKYKSGEKLYWRVWFIFALMIGFCASALYFYNIAITNKFLSPQQSDALNRECVLFDYFDDHDIWHYLSACAVVLLYLGVYWLDIDIQEKPRNEIKVF